MEKKIKKYIGNDAIKKIIAVWAQFSDQLRGAHKNSHIYAKMCSQLAMEHAVSLTPDEVRTRINNLAKKYRKERKLVGPSGGAPSNWEYYTDIHKIIGGYKSNYTHELADESFGNGNDSINTSEDTLPTDDEKDDVASTSSSAKKRKKNSDEDFLELARKEQKMMEEYLNKSVKNEEKALSLMENTNTILLAILNKK